MAALIGAERLEMLYNFTFIFMLKLGGKKGKQRKMRSAEFMKNEISLTMRRLFLALLPTFNKISAREHLAADLLARVCGGEGMQSCLLYTSPSPRDRTRSRMPSSA